MLKQADSSRLYGGDEQSHAQQSVATLQDRPQYDLLAGAYSRKDAGA